VIQGPKRSAFGVQSLSEAECYELLEATTVGRIAFNSSEGLQIIPINFAVVSGSLFFRTSPEGLLSQLACGAEDVAFEADYHSRTGPRGWSVLIKGSVRALAPDEAAQITAEDHLVPWADGDRTLYLRLDPAKVSGRRVSRSPMRPTHQ
jgi:nitroimidazol reductase NimA-like FMN-containing flavoprotein (pyridoxamine 5'-phosphate oxidase superfamily)